MLARMTSNLSLSTIVGKGIVDTDIDEVLFEHHFLNFEYRCSTTQMLGAVSSGTQSS